MSFFRSLQKAFIEKTFNSYNQTQEFVENIPRQTFGAFTQNVSNNLPDKRHDELQK